MTKPPPERGTWTAAKAPAVRRDLEAESHWDERQWHGDSDGRW